MWGLGCPKKPPNNTDLAGAGAGAQNLLEPGSAEMPPLVPALPRGQIPSPYLEDVLSRVEAGGAAAHHADPRRRGRRGQPAPQTCRGERQAGP